MSYAELQCTSHFSFLRGASSPDELFLAAHERGLSALAITDHGSLAGMVRAHQAAKETGVRLVVGARLDLDDGLPVLVYPTCREAYAKLCRLLTIGKARAGKGACRLTFADLVAHGEKFVCILLPDQADENLFGELRRLREAFGDRAYLALTRRLQPGDPVRLAELSDLAWDAHVKTVATGDVLYHATERRILQDVVTCIRLGTTIDAVGFGRERFPERHLKSPEEQARLFDRYPEAVARSCEIAERCRFSLDELRYQYPHEAQIPGLTAQEALERKTWEAAKIRYPGGLPEKVDGLLRHELQLIAQMRYAPYFLTVHAIVQEARRREILCQGRGSAANSAVCYVLGITSIDPQNFSLLFERFVSPERREPPDIDVDFEHERREEIIQWIYDTYGRDRAALCATVIRYRSRGALRDVGKVLGVPEDVLKGLSGLTWGWSTEGISEREAAELNLNLEDRRLRMALELARQLIGAPRHLSQHPGGFVLTQDRLDDLVPIEPAAMEDRAVIEWDKDDIDVLKFMKVDVLGLGMLGCMRRAFDLLAEHKGEDRDLANIPEDDEKTYAMIRKADTLGVFQIESRAQMSMLPRLRPKVFYDLVIQVAIVRPGPIQGNMVHPYLQRRENPSKVDYPSPALKEVLEKTLGVPLFQEQAMQVAIVGAGFTPSEADQLRRAMATFKNVGTISRFREKLIEGMLGRGYEKDFAERTFKQLEGFASYGFPESHAASFARIAYASSWMKCHHPDVFCCALLNAQPMGFYAPAQIVRDARQHGVEVRPVDVNQSHWDSSLEERPDGSFAVRLGLRLAKGFGTADGEDVLLSRGDFKRAKAVPDAQPKLVHAPTGKIPFVSLDDVWRRCGVPVAALEKLADADAFASLGLARRAALWAIRGFSDAPLPLFDAADAARKESVVPGEAADSCTASRPEEPGLLESTAPPPSPLRGRDGGIQTPPKDLRKSTPLPAPRGGLPHKGGGGETPRGPRRSPPGEGQAIPAEEFAEPRVTLPAMTAGGEVVADYGSIGLTLRSHPVGFLRGDLERAGMVPNAALSTLRNGQRTKLAGIVLVRQRPGTASGVIFVTLEDETGIANLVVWSSLFERQRRVVLQASMMGVEGRVQRVGEVIHVVADRLLDLSDLLRSVGEREKPFPLPAGRGDEARHGAGPDIRPDSKRRTRAIPGPHSDAGIRVKSRDFH